MNVKNDLVCSSISLNCYVDISVNIFLVPNYMQCFQSYTTINYPIIFFGSIYF